MKRINKHRNFLCFPYQKDNSMTTDDNMRERIHNYVTENRQKKIAKLEKEMADLNITIAELTNALAKMQNAKKNTRAKASTNTLDGYTRSTHTKEGK